MCSQHSSPQSCRRTAPLPAPPARLAWQVSAARLRRRAVHAERSAGDVLHVRWKQMLRWRQRGLCSNNNLRSFTDGLCGAVKAPMQCLRPDQAASCNHPLLGHEQQIPPSFSHAHRKTAQKRIHQNGGRYSLLARLQWTAGRSTTRTSYFGVTATFERR